MAGEVFVDTSGFYSLLVRTQSMHQQASAFMARAARERKKFITTDYVLDEGATLLRARGHGTLLAPLFETIEASSVVRVEWTTPQRFNETKAFFLQHADKAWSFTDCLSFVVMRALELREALTSDIHFEQAGFRRLLNP